MAVYGPQPQSDVPAHSEDSRLGIVELFAGAAGLAQGFLQTDHYDLIALTDWDAAAQQTVAHNLPHVPYIRKDIQRLKASHLRDRADGRHIHGVLGGPPCQGFSLAGLMKAGDERNRLIKDYVHLVQKLDPDFLLMENVPQVIFHGPFQDLLKELEKKYTWILSILNAARYGTPQTRHRAFLIALHRRLNVTPSFPTPTHGLVRRPVYSYPGRRFVKPSERRTAAREILGSDPVVGMFTPVAEAMASQLEPFIRVEDAIGDLASLGSGELSYKYASPPRAPYQRTIRAGMSDVLNHEARHHLPTMLDLMKLVPEGGDLSDVDESYWPKSHYSQAYGRLHRRGLARTITTFFCNPGSGRFTHPTDSRSLTIREASRLQGFRDDFEFIGTQTSQMTLVGNAVPLPLARSLGDHIWALIGSLAGTERAA